MLGSTLFAGASVGYSQHLHQHGNHIDVHQNVPHGHDHAGHLTDNLGHHIDGHGRHTGAIGVYENGAASFHPPHNSFPSYSSNYHSGYGYSNYGYYPGSYQGYASSYPYSSWGNSSYYGGLGYNGIGYSGIGYSGLGLSVTIPSVRPSVVVVPQNNLNGNWNNNSLPTILGPSQILGTPAAGLAAASPQPSGIVTNKIPLPAGGVAAGAVTTSAGKIVLRNPRTTEGSLHYVLNEFPYTIKPGESQTIAADRGWVLQFDNGLGKTVSQTLQPGEYRFGVSQETGWEIGFLAGSEEQ